jgi:hypothetical protein
VREEGAREVERERGSEGVINKREREGERERERRESEINVTGLEGTRV